MSHDFDKTLTGIQENTDPGKAPSSAPGGGVDPKKAILVGVGLLAMLGILFGISQAKRSKGTKKGNADEAAIHQVEAGKRAEAQAKVGRIEQAPLGKDSKFDEAGNFLGPNVAPVELPENRKAADLKTGKNSAGSNPQEGAIEQLAGSPQGEGGSSQFSGSYKASGGGGRRGGEEQDASVIQAQHAVQKEERGILESSMLGYSRNRASAPQAGAPEVRRGAAEEAAARTDALRTQAMQQQAMHMAGAPGGPAAGSVGGESTAISAPGRGRTFTRPGELADMRIFPGSEAVRVPEGKSLECVLVNRVLAQANESPVIVTLSRDFRSPDGRLLGPAGARLVGKAERISDMNQERMFIAFNRIDYPNGETAWFPEHRIGEGLDTLGSLGIQGKVKRGLVKALVASVALGVVEGLGAAAAGPVRLSTTTGITEISAGQMAVGKVSNQLDKFSERVLTRYMNMVPQVILMPGQRLRIYLSEDTLMSVYPEAR